MASILFLLLMTSLMFMGCDSIAQTWNDYHYQGTNVGYQRCVERNTGVALSEETVRFQCLSKHEKFVEGSRGAEGKAGYSRHFDVTSFAVSIKNTFTDEIITTLFIWIKHKEHVNSDGKHLIEILFSRKVWIEPDETKDVVFSDLKFTPNLDIDQDGLFQWGIAKIGRLKIALR